jgi:sugar/nucleoside kinase (ribokinase family)
VSTESPVVLVVGAASRDVVDDDPRGWRLGGAVTFASLALARLGLEAWALAGADREAEGARELDLLRDAGVTLAFARLDSGPVFDNLSHLLLSTSDRISLTALPRRWTSGFDALLVVPVADEVGPEWADAAVDAPRTSRATSASRTPRPSGAAVGLGWQGLLRVLQRGELIAPRAPVASPLLAAAHLVVVSEADVADDVSPEAMHGFLRPDATLVWTEGAGGGQVVTRDATDAVVARRYPAIPPDRVIDPTGAGDVFLAAMLAARLQPGLGDPVTVAAAASSLAVEGPGLEGVPDLAAVRRRMTRPPSLASR